MKYILRINNADIFGSITLFKPTKEYWYKNQNNKESKIKGWIGLAQSQFVPVRNIQAENLYPIRGLSHSVKQ